MCYMSLFRMPTVIKITRRSSSITNAFINTIIPVIPPNEDDVKQALHVLGLNKNRFECVYCGDGVTEWDHLRPLVLEQQPTGYISEIQNLVPSCSKCNQSKGNKDWQTWMLSDAPKSPNTRNIKNLDERVEKLIAYEKWRNPTQLDFKAIVGDESWEQHWNNWKAVLETMQKAQVLADNIRDKIAEHSEAHENPISKEPLPTEQGQQIVDNSLDNEINKVRKKLNRWIRRPNQICCKILNKYLEISEHNPRITKTALKSALPELHTFDSNFDQMRIISERNHAKIFELNGEVINIWEPVKSLVNSYKYELFGRAD